MRETSAGQMAAALTLLLQKKFGGRGRDLEAMLRRAGRRLPAHAHRHARLIAAAARRQDHARLHRQDDPARLARSFKIVKKQIESVDLSRRRIDLILSILGSVAFALLFVFAAVVTVLRWRGFL